MQWYNYCILHKTFPMPLFHTSTTLIFEVLYLNCFLMNLPYSKINPRLRTPIIIHSCSLLLSPSILSLSKKWVSIPVKSLSWILVKSIAWRRMKRLVAHVDGFDNCACWFEVDQMGSIDSPEVTKGCNIVILVTFTLASVCPVTTDMRLTFWQSDICF